MAVLATVDAEQLRAAIESVLAPKLAVFQAGLDALALQVTNQPQGSSPMLQLIETSELRSVAGGSGITGRVGVVYQIRGTGVAYLWDAVTGVHVPAGSSLGVGDAITSITYNGSGQITAYTSAGVAYTIAYNGNGTVNTVSGVGVTRTMTYNGDGTAAAYQ